MEASYFDYLPMEITSLILSSGESLMSFSQAYPNLREGVIKDFFRKSDMKFYKICENIINDLGISWYTVTYYILFELKIVLDEDVTVSNRLRIALDYFINYEGDIVIDENINYGDTNNEYHISVSIVTLYSGRYHRIYEYIRDHKLYVRYGLNIFSWIYLNIVGNKFKNIVLSPDLDCNVMKDIIKLIDEDF